MALRVLWITQGYRWIHGGVQVYTGNVLRELNQVVDLKIISEKSPWLPELSNADYVWTTGLGRPQSNDEWHRNRELLRQTVVEWEPHVIHYGDAGLAAYNSYMYLRKFPVVATIHGNDLSKPWQKVPGESAVNRIVSGLSSCRRLITLSEYVKRLCRTAGINTPVSIIRPGTDTEIFKPLNIDRLAVLERYSITGDVPVILTAGRIIPRKGHALVLDALRLLSQPFHWLIVGESKGEAEVIRETALKYGLEEHITIVDGVGQRELASLYNACDLFVFTPIEIASEETLDTEGFGLVLFEASATGLPVISSDISGCREAVVNGETGLLVPAGNPKILAEAIRELLNNKKLREQMTKAGILHIRHLGSWRKYVNELLNIYSLARSS